MADSQDLRGMSWRQLVASLAAHGLRRAERETRQSLIARLSAVEGEANASTSSVRPRLQQVILIEATPELVSELAAHFSPRWLQVLTSRTAVIAPSRLSILRRTLTRLGHPLAPPARARRPIQPETSPPTSLRAAAQFIQCLATLLDWPPDAIGSDLRRYTEPAEGNDPDVTKMLRLWRALLDAALDGDDAERGPGEIPARDNLRSSDETVVQWRALLERAIAERRCVRIRYWTAARDALTERVVEPITLQAFQGGTFLHAFCRWRQALRVFRLNRVVACEVLDERFG